MTKLSRHYSLASFCVKIFFFILTNTCTSISAEIFSEAKSAGTGNIFSGIGITELRTIYVEGDIESGDLKKIQDEAKRGFVYRVQFWSRGGNLDEAIKISDFLYQKKIMVSAPSLNTSGTSCESISDIRPRKRENCTCTSACAIVWLLAPFRSGYVVGVHRPRYDTQYFSSLSPDEAKKSYDLLMSLIREKMISFQIDIKIIEKNFSTPSDKMYYLTETEVNEIGDELPFLYEYIKAKCSLYVGEKIKYDNIQKNIKLLSAKLKKILSKVDYSWDDHALAEKLQKEIEHLYGESTNVKYNWDACYLREKLTIQFEAQR